METDTRIAPIETGRPWWMVCCTGCLLLFVALVIVILVFTNIVPEPARKALDTARTQIMELTARYRK